MNPVDDENELRERATSSILLCCDHPYDEEPK